MLEYFMGYHLSFRYAGKEKGECQQAEVVFKWIGNSYKNNCITNLFTESIALNMLLLKMEL